jgi:uncharacterized membrane protein YfcA
MSVKILLLAALALVTLAYLATWVRYLRSPAAHPEGKPGLPTPLQTFIGFVTNFFDTLGIGSYAPTTAMYKFWHVVPDERIPGTLTIGHSLATITQAFIFMALVQVNAVTLALMIASAVAGAWLGAGVVAAWPRRNIQIGMGLALVAAAILFTFANLGLMPGGGTELELGNLKLALGLAGNFVLGALMTIGIGLYAPCMILVSLLGMDPKAAFPIMMGSCAFLMPISSVKFLRVNSYSIRPALGLLLGGVPAVLIAALIVKSLPLTTVRWLVVVVVLYSASMMLRSAWAERGQREVSSRK